MEKTMMILGASALQVPAIKKAKALGYKIILVDYDKDAVGFPLADVKLVVSTLDKEEVCRQAYIYKPDVVITSTSDGPVRTAAYVNEKLGKRPDLSYEDSLCATIKSHMRKRLQENGVPIPEYYTAENYDEFRTALCRLHGRCVLKPADNAGSRGVQLIDVRPQTADSVNAAAKTEDDLRRMYEYSKANARNGLVMVEEFMEGREVSVEAITIDGETHILAVTDKYITPPPYFVELAHCEPSVLSDAVKEEVKKVALQAVSAIGIQNAPSHTEIKVTKDGAKVVEVAARLGGDYITSKLVPLSTGIDMVGASVELAAGMKPDISAKFDRAAAICFLQADDGVLEEIVVPDEVYSIEGIEEVVLYQKAGAAVSSTRPSNDRLGHVIAVADTPDKALETAKKALGLIRVKLR